MCLAVPGKILTIEDQDDVRMAKADFGGVIKDVCLAYLPDLEIGDYAIVHVGFAIQKLDEASALETLELFRSIGALEEELGDPSRQDSDPSTGAGADPESAT
jgi:hydrogenase expression/formation protein HypC